MARKLVSDEELLSWMNAELNKEGDFPDCRFEAPIYWLKLPASNGCNWSIPHVRCSGTPASACRERASVVAAEAQTLFNLK